MQNMKAHYNMEQTAKHISKISHTYKPKPECIFHINKNKPMLSILQVAAVQKHSSENTHQVANASSQATGRRKPPLLGNK